MGERVLGVTVACPDEYSPKILEGIPRSLGRESLNPPLLEGTNLPFSGEDVWNCYEASWLDSLGAPKRGILELRVPCETPRLVESKSLKLYLNSLNFKKFDKESDMLDCIIHDLIDVVGGTPQLRLLKSEPQLLNGSVWECIDDEEVAMSGEFEPHEDFITCEADPNAKMVEEQLVCHLLRTNCPVTNQPDWGSVLVHYRGKKIDRKSLKKYICSLRKEVGFHELCVEMIFLAIMKRCEPALLTVAGRFMRRGGIDINPVRSTRPLKESAWAEEQCRVPGQ